MRIGNVYAHCTTIFAVKNALKQNLLNYFITKNRELVNSFQPRRVMKVLLVCLFFGGLLLGASGQNNGK